MEPLRVSSADRLQVARLLLPLRLKNLTPCVILCDIGDFQQQGYLASSKEVVIHLTTARKTVHISNSFGYHVHEWMRIKHSSAP